MNIEENKAQLIDYIEKASVVILGLVFIFFPLLFTNITTDFFTLPKQVLIIFATSVLLLLFGAKTLLLEKVRIRRTPFDLAVILFLGALLLSSVFSSAWFESLTNFVPVFFSGLLFFAIVNNVKNEKSVLVLFSAFLTGAVILSVISILYYFKIYVFPFDFTKVNTFTTIGSSLEQALYLLLVLPIGVYLLSPFIFKKKKEEPLDYKPEDITKVAGFGVASLIILMGLILSIYIVVKVQPSPILPMETGFQTGFAAISQDNGRIFKGFLVGTGFGEYLIDFTRFKPPSFNANQTLWSFTFIRSSSFVLELLATTGLLGLLSFLFLCFKVFKEKPLFIPLIIALAVCFILPISFFNITVIFFILGLYTSLRGLNDDKKYFDVEIQLVTLKKGFISFSPEEPSNTRGYGKALPYFVFGLIAVVVLVLGFLTYDYLTANTTFQKSLAAASQNNGQLTYTYQSSALSGITGSHVDSYYRVFSQTNLALANSLAGSVPQGASVSAQTQQTIYQLVQQSINAARQATVVSPQNTINWQNLANVYSNIIGFGQNADSFAILAAQQAVILNPSNPQAYITLGGIYYQIRSWDKAAEQFQLAINLKPDYANAYYNLGHAMEERGDLQGALTQFQSVKSLIVNDPTNLAKINGEISAIQNQIGQQQKASQGQIPTTSQTQTPLNVGAPSGTLPPHNPPIKIPAPQTNNTVTPTPTGEPTTTPTPSQ